MTKQPAGTVVGTERVVWLHEGWQLARCAPEACAGPAALGGAALAWREAVVPGTVALAVHEDIDTPGAYDADDWWYRLRFPAPEGPERALWRLRFDGLATLADVWLNGTPLLSSRNMFVGRRADVTGLLRDDNELVIRFASLERALAAKRARPRWKTALVAQQNLRWFRTTLVGRIPGWTPPIAPVGPWGPIALECVDRVELGTLALDARADAGVGHLRLDARLDVLAGHRLDAARVRVGDAEHALALEQAEGGARAHGDIALADVPLWWPHTHGTPHLVACHLELRVDGEWLTVDVGPIGFRALELDRQDGAVRYRVNGVAVFCRGACWTPIDVLALRGEPSALRAALETARDAGVNMLRVGGTMAYESPEFYRLCDELGILVWQDFMFANMDYPVDDPEFRAQVEEEARHQLGRLRRHACIAAYCGGSEIAQQAAMLGLPAEQWCNGFFGEALPRLCRELHPGIPYFPSTPWGGALPFHVGTGIAHYYGVGAYRRPLSDVRAARVKFATECLAFANVPEPETTALVLGTPTPPPHHPKWKARQPRDTGAGWDFEDIRDHYLRALYGVDPVALRSQDLARYYALSRAVSGEVMRRAFAEWRSPSSGCGGALVWFWRDFWPGAGWGVVDATGRAKPALWHLKRGWAPRSVHLTDEGLDGLAVHVVNEGAEALAATVEVELLRAGRRAAEGVRQDVLVPPRGALSLHLDALLGYFSDSTAAYRFGPPRYDVIAVRLCAPGGAVLGEDFHFPVGMGLPVQHGARVEGVAAWTGEGVVELSLTSDVFLQSVAIASEGFVPDDNHFHLAPRREKRVTFVAADRRAAAFKAHIEALNLAQLVTVRAQRQPGEKTA